MNKMIHTTVPSVSVVIPTHNRRELLKCTIESLFNHSYPKDRYEIIVIDNASSDGTEKMIQSLQSEAPCILKFGIKKASGDIVAFTDSDCVADRDWLKNGVSKMSEGFGLVQGKTLPKADQTRRKLHHTMEITSENGFYQTCNIFYRKEILDRVEGFSPDFCGLDFFGTPRWGGEDTDLAWRVKKQGWRSGFTGDAIVYHHVFPLSPFKILFGTYYRTGIIVFPRIVKRHPELRDIILYRKIFKHKRRALFYLFLLSLLSGLSIHWGFFLLSLPYVIKILRRSFYSRPIRSYHRGLALFGLNFFTELFHTVFLICTSLIYRTIVL
jgi:glycosyltransferase involved in cell wall biosynthesis